MQVPYDEGVANHIDPESCAVAREGGREALTGERAGQAIEPRKYPLPGCRRRSADGRQYGCARYRERPDGPAWSENLACADALCSGTGRSHDRPATARVLHWSVSGRRGAVADDVRS